MDRRIPMVLHSLALRDVATLWVEIMFILDRSEGLAVLAGVSSSVHCHLSVFFSRVDTGHVFPLLYISSSFGWVRPGSNVLPFHIRSFGFLLEGSVSCGVCSALGCGTLW